MEDSFLMKLHHKDNKRNTGIPTSFPTLVFCDTRCMRNSSKCYIKLKTGSLVRKHPMHITTCLVGKKKMIGTKQEIKCDGASAYQSTF